ncbi:MAG TPA: hypothetical protein VF109_10955, partial [Mycobacteriales bacterium]
MFGNTRAVADAIAGGLAPAVEAEVVDVLDAPLTVGRGVDLLVVGGPTQAFGMSRPGTRQDAAQQARRPPDVARIGVREWLDQADPGDIRTAAAFDTGIGKRWVPGSAAHGIGKALRGLGATLVLAPETFKVTGTQGPLAAGEVDRAREWGRRLAEAVIAGRETSRG